MLTSFDQPHRHVPSCCKPRPMRTWVTAQSPTEDAGDLTEAKSGHITPPLKFSRTPVTLRKQQVYKVLLGLAWASSLSSSPVSLPLIPSPSSAKRVLLPFLKYSRTAIPLVCLACCPSHIFRPPLIFRRGPPPPSPLPYLKGTLPSALFILIPVCFFP